MILDCLFKLLISIVFSNYLVLCKTFWHWLSFSLFKLYLEKFKLRLFKAINLLRCEAKDINPVSVIYLLLDKLKYSYRNNLKEKVCRWSKSKELYEDSKCYS